ncbi:hypothetical protein B9Z19DRAFT_1142957, partial [Tuber borchii]
ILEKSLKPNESRYFSELLLVSVGTREIGTSPILPSGSDTPSQPFPVSDDVGVGVVVLIGDMDSVEIVFLKSISISSPVTVSPTISTFPVHLKNRSDSQLRLRVTCGFTTSMTSHFWNCRSLACREAKIRMTVPTPPSMSPATILCLLGESARLSSSLVGSSKKSNRSGLAACSTPTVRSFFHSTPSERTIASWRKDHMLFPIFDLRHFWNTSRWSEDRGKLNSSPDGLGDPFARNIRFRVRIQL